MNDTSPELAERYRALLMQRSGSERVVMGCEMFDAARRLVRASLGDPTGTDHSPALRVALFLRVYGADFDPVTRARLAAQLRDAGARRAGVPPSATP